MSPNKGDCFAFSPEKFAEAIEIRIPAPDETITPEPTIAPTPNLLPEFPIIDEPMTEPPINNLTSGTSTPVPQVIVAKPLPDVLHRIKHALSAVAPDRVVKHGQLLRRVLGNEIRRPDAHRTNVLFPTVAFLEQFESGSCQFLRKLRLQRQPTLELRTVYVAPN